MSGQFEPKLLDEDKNPVQRVNEHCQKRKITHEFKVDPEQGPYGCVTSTPSRVCMSP